MSAKIDLNQLCKVEWTAPRRPVLLDLPPARYLAVTGEGAPGGEVFQARIGALYAVAYTVKMTRKFSGQQDYSIGKLSGRYFGFDRKPLPAKTEWRWQLLIRTPDCVAPDELGQAVAKLRQRGKEGDAARVTLETLAEGRCVQMLHIGPYDREGETIAVMSEFAANEGLRLTGPHHEIYLSDPRRMAPEKLKTILREPVTPV